MIIKSLSDIACEMRGDVQRQVEEIFFEASSKKEFASLEKKQHFYKRWCGDYQTSSPQEFFLALEGPRVLGYLSGHSNSFLAVKELEVPGLDVFADLFDHYPAHLHINFRSECRGQGLGSVLIEHYLQFLKKARVKGVHIVTTLGMKNVHFYERLGFTFTQTREYKGSELYFMGRVLE